MAKRKSKKKLSRYLYQHVEGGPIYYDRRFSDTDLKTGKVTRALQYRYTRLGDSGHGARRV